MFNNHFSKILTLLLVSLLVKFLLLPFVDDSTLVFTRVLISITILIIGAFYIISGTAKVIEETTEILHERTHLAGGLLQSFGTAFPDMVIGIVAAVVSLRMQRTDYSSAINYAIIAASTTFGSNIYNIGHASWCLYRQNIANVLGRSVNMIPFLKRFGQVKPLKNQAIKPSLKEFDIAINASTALTILTSGVAIGMVIFGQVSNIPTQMSGDLYQLTRPIGFIIFVFAILTLLKFRKSERDPASTKEITKEENYYRKKSSLVIWFSLLISGIAILFAAESMIFAVESLSQALGIPVVISGLLSGLIGCLGEITVVHNYSIHPNGRMGDAVVGVAMDNIVTIMGASIVALIGGVFLGGRSLILIFVIILTLNTILISQINSLKAYLPS